EPRRTGGLRRVARRDVVPRGARRRAAVGWILSRRSEAARDRPDDIRPWPCQRAFRGHHGHRLAIRSAESAGGRAMKNFVLVPDALVVTGALAVLLLGRARRRPRWWMPVAAAAVTLVALAVELWAGAVVSTYFGGALVQDRFALFAKAAVLLAATLAIAVTDWSDEDAP